MLRYKTPLFLLLCLTGSLTAEVFMANGMKIGDVTADTAIVWTRLTEKPERTRSGIEWLKGKRAKAYKLGEVGSEQFPEGATLNEMEGSVPGATGKVRLLYWPKGQKGKLAKTDWQSVDKEKDFTHQFALKNLAPNTHYVLSAEGRDGSSSIEIEGRFRTAPLAEEAEEINFVVVTCGDYPRRDDAENGHMIYKTMLEQLDPNFFVHTGDIEYYDMAKPYALTTELAHYKWNRLFSMPYIRNFHNQVSSYFIKDDHDTVKDDCDPGDTFGTLTWDDGIAIFEEQFPRAQPYKTVRWGKDLEVWIVEGRDFRKTYKKEDPNPGVPTIWGEEQMEWFLQTFADSDATFRVLISPTPVIGPDRKSKSDNHSNQEFEYEGNKLREFLSTQDNAFIICGDRHWQYHSIEPTLGVHEFSCGPSSDKHAGGYKEELRDEYHQYLKILGGFLSVNVSRDSGEPTITFSHHAPNGDVRYTYQQK